MIYIYYSLLTTLWNHGNTTSTQRDYESNCSIITGQKESKKIDEVTRVICYSRSRMVDAFPWKASFVMIWKHVY